MSDIFVDNIKHQSSQGSGTITLGASGETVALASGVVQSNLNYPAFRARKSSNQNISPSTNTVITFPNEVYDTDGAYDISNSRFTVPSGKGGKYFFLFINRIRNAADITSIEYSFYVNGSKEDRLSVFHDYSSGDSQYQSYQLSTNFNLSASDYVEVYVNHNGSGAMEINGGTGITLFQGFRIGT